MANSRGRLNCTVFHLQLCPCLVAVWVVANHWWAAGEVKEEGEEGEMEVEETEVARVEEKEEGEAEENGEEKEEGEM